MGLSLEFVLKHARNRNYFWLLGSLNANRVEHLPNAPDCFVTVDEGEETFDNYQRKSVGPPIFETLMDFVPGTVAAVCMNAIFFVARVTEYHQEPNDDVEVRHLVVYHQNSTLRFQLLFGEI